MNNSGKTAAQLGNFLERRYSGQHPIRTLLVLYQNDRKRLFLALLFYFIKASGVWAMPIITASIVDVISMPDQHSISELWVYAGFLAVIFIQNIPTHYLYVWFLSMATRNMESNLRAALSRQLQHLSISFYFRNSTGALQSKLLRDVEAIEQLTRQLFETIPYAVITMVVAIVVTAIRAPWFLIFFVVTVPAAAVLIRTLRGAMTNRNHNLRAEVESMSSRLTEMIHLIPITRAHGIEEDELIRLEEKLEEVRAAAIRLDSINAIFGASSWVTFRLFDVLCLVVSSFIAYTHALPITVGDVVLLTGFFSNLTNSVLQLTNVFPQISKGFESIRSLGEILECPDLEHNEGKRLVESVQGHFVFESVAFSYPDSEISSLKDISLTIQPGETVAIVGESGAGKSTLLNLIIGFLRPSAGRILLDGQDMNQLDLRTYRRFLSVVSQETILFKGTIRDNILYGAPSVSEEQFQKALEDANAKEFIDQLPDGVETMLGENGARLSGGQKQRIAIARALIRDPKVLVLDEATSALDTLSEALVQEALTRLMRNRTTFVVAHRFSTIRNADRIVVLGQGRIAEVGSHAELLAKKGTYAHLRSVESRAS